MNILNTSRLTFFKSMLTRADDKAGLAALRHSSGEISGAWLRAIPYDNTASTVLSPEAFRLALRARLRLKINNSPSCPLCNAAITPDSSHPFSCVRSGLYARHNRIRDFVGDEMAKLAGFRPPAGEAVLESDTSLQRADKRIPGAAEDESKDLLIDTYCIDPSLPSRLSRGTHNNVERVFEIQDSVKNSTYRPLINPSRESFLPCGFTPFGSISTSFNKLFLKFCDRIATISGKSNNATRRHYRAALSVQIQKHNAAIYFRGLDRISDRLHSRSTTDILRDNNYFFPSVVYHSSYPRH